MDEVKTSPTDLIKRIREHRKCTAKVGAFTFHCRRPTDREAADWYRAGAKDADIYLSYVIGWDGPTENDVVGGGGTDPVDFDLLLWREWVVDRVDFWEPIVTAVVKSYQDHQKDMEAAEKK